MRTGMVVLMVAATLVGVREGGSATQGGTLLTAYPTDRAPTLDGQIGPAEYDMAMPVYVEFSEPDTPPGIVPNGIPLPTSATDLSYTVYTLYTGMDLYVAVDVTDDVLQDDSELAWKDDDVELFFDGDLVGNDISLGWAQASAEGFQIMMDIGGDKTIREEEEYSCAMDWSGATGTRPGGRVTEFRIPLTGIDTEDGLGVRPPGPGDSIGFNITVGDDDNGGEAYEELYDSYGAWTGSYDSWRWNGEDDWGRLYFATSQEDDGGPGSRTPGATLWELRISAEGQWPDWAGFSSPAVSDDGTIYVGSSDSSLYAVSPSGTVSWRISTDGRIEGSPAIGADGTVYFASLDGYLYAAGPDGSLRWRHSVQAGTRSTPAIDDGRSAVYLLGDSGSLWAFSTDGSVRWTFAVGGHDRYSPAIGRDGTVYVPSRYVGLIALSPAGVERWRYALPQRTIVTPAVDRDGTVYFSSFRDYNADSWLYALEPDGTLKWRFAAGTDSTNGQEMTFQGAPSIAEDGTLYIGGSTSSDWNFGFFHALNPDGTLKWRHDSRLGNCHYWTSPTLGVDGSAYATRWSGPLHAYSPDGVLEWTSEAFTPTMHSSPALTADGILYVASHMGYLHAIDTGTSGGLALSPWPKIYHDLRNTSMATVDSLAPSILAMESRTVPEGQTLRLTLQATDPDGDALRFVMAGAPAGGALEGDQFTWTPSYGQAGAYSVTFVVTDDQDGTDRLTVPLTVSNVNRPPDLAVVGGTVTEEGIPLSLVLRASDPDADPLSLSVQGNAPGSVLTDSLFTWTPGYSASGSYQLTFRAADEWGGVAEQAVTVRVDERNGSPRLSPLVSQAILELDSLRLSMSATDPEGEHLTWTAAGAPPGSSLADSVFAWTPALYTRGTYRVQFAVTDTRGGTDSVSVAITVTARTRYLTTSVDTLSFSAVSVGQSKTLMLTVSNAGTESLTVTNVVPGDPQYTVSSGSFTLLGGSARDVAVTFAPLAGRSALSTLTLVSNDPERPVLTVVLTAATGVVEGPAVLSVLPTSLTFGSVAIGQSRSVTLLVINEGGSNLRVLNVVPSSSNVTVSTAGFALAPGAEEVLTVTLQPTVVGTFSETLDLQSNDPAHPLVQVPLRGTVVTSGGTASLSLSVTSISFGQVEVGATSEFLLPVRNVGSGSLVVSNAVSDNTQVVVSPTSILVAPQETGTLTVLFRPLPGRERSGRVTLYTNDQQQPQVGLSWSAQEVSSPYLTLRSQTPTDGSYGVATLGELELRFSEPLFHRRGFTALDVELRPEPLSGALMGSMEVRGDGSVVVFPVELARDQVYRLVVYGATGWSGLGLFEMMETTFSTGVTAPVVAAVSGRVVVEEGQALSGSVYLYDLSPSLVSQESVSLDGSFSLTGVSAGTYRLYLEGTLDGEPAGGAYDANGDGRADVMTVVAGVDQAGLEIVPVTRSGSDPVVATSQVQVDLDGDAGNQRVRTQWGVSGGQELVLEVYASGVEQLTGSAVTVSYDTSAVYFTSVEEGDHLLSSGEGTALFLTHVDPVQSTVAYGGSILGPTVETAVSGSGLLGRFHFTTVEGFSGTTSLTVTHVTLNTLTGKTKTPLQVSAVANSSAEEVYPEGPIALDFNPAGGDQGQRAGGSAVSGKRYGVQLHVTGAPEIDGWSARIEYDGTQVQYVAGSFVASGFISNLTALVDDRQGSVSVGGTVLGAASSGSGSGSLGTLEFEVLPGFGQSTELVVTQVSLKHVETGEEIQSVRHVVTITTAPVSGGLVGDFNGDRVVDFSDFFLFADAFGGTDPQCDLSGDGQVDFSDFFLFADAFGSEELGKLLALARTHLGLPQATTLGSNYPNPFNGATSIPFVLSRPGRTEVSVYALSGQRVATLVGGEMAAGRHQVVWDGWDESGVAVASGVYVVRLVTPDQHLTRKITLVR